VAGFVGSASFACVCTLPVIVHGGCGSGLVDAPVSTGAFTESFAGTGEGAGAVALCASITTLVFFSPRSSALRSSAVGVVVTGTCGACSSAASAGEEGVSGRSFSRQAATSSLSLEGDLMFICSSSAWASRCSAASGTVCLSVRTDRRGSFGGVAARASEEASTPGALGRVADASGKSVRGGDGSICTGDAGADGGGRLTRLGESEPSSPTFGEYAHVTGDCRGGVGGRLY